MTIQTKSDVTTSFITSVIEYESLAFRDFSELRKEVVIFSLEQNN